MKPANNLTPSQRALIWSLGALSACSPVLRLVLIFIELANTQPVDSTNLVFHLFITPLEASIFWMMYKGIISERTFGIVSTEIAYLAITFLGNFVEPHLKSIWEMASVYIVYFIQLNLINNKAAKLYCCFKPMLGALICGFASGTLYLKSTNEVIGILVCLYFSTFGLFSDLELKSLSKELFDKLDEAKMQLSTIISAVPVGIFVLDSRGHVVLTNEACLSMVGCIEPQLILGRLAEFKCKPGTSRYEESQGLPEDLMHYVHAEATDLADFGQTQHGDIALRWLGQKTTWDAESAVVVVIKDVTDVISLERTVGESRFKNVLLRSVSHELKTPTNGILHSVQAIVLDPNTPDWIKEKLEIAEVSCNHLLMLISDLLDYSQLISSKFRLSLSHFNVRKVLNDCVELMRLIADRKKIRLVKLFDPLLPENIYSDKNRICQVLLNLLSNAVKFTPKRGKIEVLAELNLDWKLEVAVNDTGIGIAPENIKQLFHSFGRIESSALLNPQGVGLGLHISNMLAKQLGGDSISVESTLNRGSCFKFRVNIGVEQPASIGRLASCISEFDVEENTITQPIYFFKHKSKKSPPVLVVDDSPFNRTVIIEILKIISVSCAEADNGKEALHYVIRRAQEKTPVKVIIMDFEMPEMNGPTACRAILARLNELGLEVPKIIAHTAYSSEDDYKQCRDAGMVDFLPKPSSRDDILAIVGRHLS